MYMYVRILCMYMYMYLKWCILQWVGNTASYVTKFLIEGFHFVLPCRHGWRISIEFLGTRQHDVTAVSFVTAVPPARAESC